MSTKLLGQFAECLEAKIGEPETIDGIAAASAEATPTNSTPTNASSADDADADADTDTDETLDLLEVAGGAMAKRFIPVAFVLAVLILVVILLVT